MADWYTHGGYPAQGAPGASVDARSEFVAIAASNAKLPAITGSALRLVRVNAGATALESITLATATVETYADAQAGTHHRLGTVAGTNAITAQATPTLTAYVTDQTFQCEAAGANTTAVTVNIDSVGVRNLLRPDGTALQPSDIPAANYPMSLQVRAADIVLLNPYNEVSAPLHAATAKGTIVDADEGGMVDSAASWVIKKWTFTNLWTWIQTHTETTYAALAGNASQAFARVNDFTLATEQNSTSGTSIDFTGIPSWATQIDIMFHFVRTNGVSPIFIQIGDSGGIEATGYTGAGANIAAAGTTVSLVTTGFKVGDTYAASSQITGIATLILKNAAGFQWAYMCNMNASSVIKMGSGAKATSAALDRVRITTEGGTDTFNLGTISIAYR